MQKMTYCSVMALVVTSAAFTVHAKTDAELFDDIVQFCVPCCGGDNGSRGREPELIEVLDIGNDTNRLARILVELAQTNSAWYVEMAMWGLEKYGTPAQLPFLYSCATNPAVGNRAVTAVLRIEGVTSNSVAMISNYLFQVNRFPVAHIGDRSRICCELLDRVYAYPSLSTYRTAVLDMAQSFDACADITPNAVDNAIVSVDPTYRYSRRRLATLRSAKALQDNEFLDISASTNEVWRRTYVHTFQTNYLSQAINELVAYPESALPD